MKNASPRPPRTNEAKECRYCASLVPALSIARHERNHEERDVLYYATVKEHGFDPVADHRKTRDRHGRRPVNQGVTRRG